MMMANNLTNRATRLERVAEVFGKGIFGSNGEAWLLQRKAASHMFTAKLVLSHRRPPKLKSQCHHSSRYGMIWYGGL
jgi:uncharacterized protein (DUF2384 family)